MAGNTFLFAFSHSDLFGKLVFVALFLLSIASWTIIIHKIWHLWKVRTAAHDLDSQLAKRPKDPFALKFSPTSASIPNPFWKLFTCLKKSVHQIKNRGVTTDSDLRHLQARVESTIVEQMHLLEKNLFVLTITVSLAPFLGLLGTVWGILTTFSELQGHKVAGGQQLVLGGLSMALATTVLGLIVAIPALVGHATIKSFVRDVRQRMHRFSSELQGALELESSE